MVHCDPTTSTQLASFESGPEHAGNQAFSGFDQLRLPTIADASRNGRVCFLAEAHKPIAYSCARLVNRGSAQNRALSLARHYPHHADAKTRLTGRLEPPPEHKDFESLAVHLDNHGQQASLQRYARRVRLSGCPAVRLSGCPAVRLSGCPARLQSDSRNRWAVPPELRAAECMCRGQVTVARRGGDAQG
jgi:hypothetical protein